MTEELLRRIAHQSAEERFQRAWTRTDFTQIFTCGRFPLGRKKRHWRGPWEYPRKSFRSQFSQSRVLQTCRISFPPHWRLGETSTGHQCGLSPISWKLQISSPVLYSRSRRECRLIWKLKDGNVDHFCVWSLQWYWYLLVSTLHIPYYSNVYVSDFPLSLLPFSALPIIS